MLTSTRLAGLAATDGVGNTLGKCEPCAAACTVDTNTQEQTVFTLTDSVAVNTSHSAENG